MAERALATAFVNIVPGTKEMEKYLKGDLQKGMTGAGQKAGSDFGSSFGNSFKSMTKKLIGIGAAVAITDFVSDSISAANKLFIEAEGVKSVFGEASSSVLAFAKGAAKSAGLSESAALSAAKTFGGFATSAGLAGDQAAKFSIDLAQAAGDLSSFYGGGTEAALGALKSAMMGQYEPMLKYNQQLNEATVKQEALRLGLIKTTDGALAPQQKVLAVQSLLMQGMGVAAGDFGKYADTFDNASQTMSANFENLKANVAGQLLPVLGQVVAAINPLIEQLGVPLFNVFQKLIPLFELVANTITKLLPALDPVIAILGILIDVGVDILNAVLGPLIDMFNILVPVIVPLIQIVADLISRAMEPLGAILSGIVVPIIEYLAAIIEAFVVPVIDLLAGILGSLLEAFMPIINVMSEMIKQILPPLVDILTNYVAPIFSALVKIFLDWLAPALQWLGGIFGEFYKSYLKAFIKGFQDMMKFLQPVWDFLKPIVEGLMSMLNIKPVKLKVSTTTDKATNDLFGGKGVGAIDYSKLGGSAVGGAGGTKKTAKQISKVFKDLNKKVGKAYATYNKAVDKANKQFAEAQTKIYAAYNESVVKATATRDADLQSALKDHNANIANIQKDFAKQQADIVAESKNRLRSAFESVTAVDVGKTFADLATKNVTNLIGGLKEKLKAAKELVASAGSLASAGFSQTFIEQVIAQGPDAGNAMAKAILTATPESQAELQALFADSEKLAGHGMDNLANTLYEKSGLATEALRDMYAQSQIDLQAALDAEALAYTTKQAEIQKTFQDAMTEAAKVRDEALAEAEKALTEALTAATEALNASLKEIEKEFNDALKEFKSQLKGHAKEIASIKGDISAARAEAMKPIVITKVVNTVYQTTGLKPMATGGFVTSATPALIGEAGPEVVTPLKDFERMMGLDGKSSGATVNYYAAPNQSLDAEQALFQAMKRAKVVGAW